MLDLIMWLVILDYVVSEPCCSKRDAELLKADIAKLNKEIAHLKAEVEALNKKEGGKA